MKNQILLLLTLAVIMTGITASGVIGAEPPHPYHVSLAEVNWNAKSQKFEVALCLWPAVLEKALARQTGRSIDLEKEANIDQLLETYIGKRFTIVSTTEPTENSKKKTQPRETKPVGSTAAPLATKKTPKSLIAPPTPINTVKATANSDSPPQAPKMKWFGHESDAKQVWLYFEIAGEPGAKWTVENRVFFELNDDQLNHIQWNGSGKTETLVCNADNTRIVLSKK